MKYFPDQAELYLTDRCNLHCRYCYVGDRADLLRPEDWLRLIGELAKLKVKAILFSGGEPLLCSEFPELVRECARQGMLYRVTTNGALIDAELLQKLLPYRDACDFFQVSIDGPQEIHDAARGEGSFAMAARGVALLRQFQFPVQAKLTLGVHNAESLAAAAECIFDTLGIQYCALNWVAQMRHKAVDFRIELRQFPAVMAEFAAVLKRYPERFLAEGPWMLWQRCQAIWRERTPAEHLCPCSAADRKLCILSDGSVIRCAAVTTPVFGNVCTEALHTIWFRLLDHPMRESGECTDCRYREFCPGKCPGDDILCLARIIEAGGVIV